jgi:hypothetical protein
LGLERHGTEKAAPGLEVSDTLQYLRVRDAVAWFRAEPETHDEARWHLEA